MQLKAMTNPRGWLCPAQHMRLGCPTDSGVKLPKVSLIKFVQVFT